MNTIDENENGQESTPDQNQQNPANDAGTAGEDTPDEKPTGEDPAPEQEAPEVVPPAEKVEPPVVEPPASDIPESPAEEPTTEEPPVEEPPAEEPPAEIEPMADVPEEEDFDYTGKVKLSDNFTDAVPKSTATKLVNASGINEHFKEVMREQIKAGQFTHEYAESFKRIRSAHAAGSIYRPGSDGL